MGTHFGAGTAFPPVEPRVPTTKPLSILLVEDDAHLRRAMELALAQHGHVVLSASRASQVPGMLLGFQVDLVISDHRLPDGTSSEVMNAIRELAPQVPAMVISGYMDDETTDAMRAEGFRACLSKPIDTGRLQRAACKALGRPL
jgi:DNA-binding NtrC family response regulator